MENKSSSESSFSKRIFRKHVCYGSFDIWFLIILLALVCFGLVMMFSASYPYALNMYNDSTHFISRQAPFAAMGIVAMLIISRINPYAWKHYSALILGFSLFLLVLVLFLPEYKEGFKRWIDIKITTIQPSEVSKFAVILAGSVIYDKYKNHMSSSRPADTPIARKINKKLGAGIVRESWVPTWLFCAFFLLSAVLIYMEKHLSGCIIILGLGAVIMYLGGVRQRWFAIAIAAAAILGTLLCVYIMETRYSEGIQFIKGYMEERIVGWLDKDYDPTGTRWQTNQALYAIGSGGFFGKGLGNSIQKYMYVSEPQNDMIFSIVCEELGFVGAAFVIILFVLLVYRGIVIGLHAKTRFESLLAMGIVLQVGLQVLLNIGVATDSIPNTGISLPFFSYGGTSLIMLLCEMGVVLAISRESSLNKK